MKKFLTIALLLASTSALADSGTRRVPCGYQQITSLSAATALTVPTVAACGGLVSMATITPEAQAVRYRDDGTDPSATVGMPMAVGVTLVYEGRITAIKFFEQTGGAKLNVSYYR